MGNSSSSSGAVAPATTDDDNDDAHLDPFDGVDTLGYRVLGVQPNSPAATAGLVSFLDFMVGANNTMLLGSGEDLQEGEEYDDVNLPALLQAHLNENVELLVYNIKSQQTRLVDLVPRNDWGGAGLLGVTIRLDNYAGADERLIRVLEVTQHSPAAVAGLVSGKDFLLGTTHATLDSTATLAQILHDYQDQVVELYVYNADSDLVRTVALMPTVSWGGRGLLGAEVGVGYLHRLPHTARTTDGASVLRKIRYYHANHNHHHQRDTAGADGDSNGDGAIFELEPQLEMEVATTDESEHEEEEEEVESVALSERSESRVTAPAVAAAVPLLREGHRSVYPADRAAQWQSAGEDEGGDDSGRRFPLMAQAEASSLSVAATSSSSAPPPLQPPPPPPPPPKVMTAPARSSSDPAVMAGAAAAVVVPLSGTSSGNGAGGLPPPPSRMYAARR